jgi:hypothetical protein
MTDHELCLAAAKAAGYTVDSDEMNWIKCTSPDGLTGYWTPLEYDQDAFRLMVDCGIDIQFEKRTVAGVTYSKEGIVDWFTEHFGTNKHAAARRAITRAAAAMGVGE